MHIGVASKYPRRLAAASRAATYRFTGQDAAGEGGWCKPLRSRHLTFSLAGFWEGLALGTVTSAGGQGSIQPFPTPAGALIGPVSARRIWAASKWRA